MSKRTRDNFTQRTIDALRRRVSNCCSNPECYVLTVEPQATDPTKVIDTEDYPNTDIDTLIDIEDYEIRKAYAKKYNESCGTVIIEEQTQ